MSNRMFSKVAVGMFLVGALASMWFSGCTPTSGRYCDKICDCTGCSESEKSECVDTVDDAKKTASDEGCDDQFNAYFSCIDSELTCVSGQLDADGCDKEATELSQCTKGAVSVGGTSVAGYCASVCACIGCSSSEQSSCVSSLEDSAQNAQDAGCVNEWNMLLSCANSHLQCVNGEAMAAGCDAEVSAYSNCVQ